MNSILCLGADEFRSPLRQPALHVSGQGPDLARCRLLRAKALVVWASFAIDGVCSGAGQDHASLGTRDRRHTRDTTATRKDERHRLFALPHPKSVPGGTRCRPSARPPARSWACQPTTYCLPRYPFQPGNANEQHGSPLVPACPVAPRYRKGHPSKPPIMCPPQIRPGPLSLLRSLQPCALPPPLPPGLPAKSASHPAPQIPHLPSTLVPKALSFARLFVPVSAARSKPVWIASTRVSPTPLLSLPAPLFSLLHPSIWEIRAPLTDRTQGASRSL
ncbi:hypothetical protein CP533_4464 [Ophiocordyceps camponoti-saundersi (nom. inval.)]|nr:hypothetical protein CP533_4464 [Ophiocordyceps camponoti-saundersi (nom. inval.)]